MIILAPMAGATDLSFRVMAKEFGCDLTISEMVSAQGLLYDNQRTKFLLKSDKRESPLVIQLFGHHPETLAKAAKIIEADYQPAMIDLNMGCPTPKIVKNGDGSALLKEPDLISAIVESVVKAIEIPVTVKIRLGWDQASINCIDIAKRVENAGAHWIAVHGRTREQFYSGKANWDYIAEIKKNVSIPVVGNGDITDPISAKRMLETTGCDHLMIGRAALGKPWIFEQVKHYLATGNLVDDPSPSERLTIALNHLKLKMEFKDEQQAVQEMRSHLAWYLKGLRNSSTIRGQMNQVNTFKEVNDLLNYWKQNLA